jgi:Family of unknown function (DUF6922)
VIPEGLARLFWDVEPSSVDLVAHRDYVMERVMSRGDWEAMRWLCRVYSTDELTDFLTHKGERLSARDRAYWALVAGVTASQIAGGGRPKWAG